MSCQLVTFFNKFAYVCKLSQDGFESDCPDPKFQTIISWSQFEKITVQKSTMELWSVISNQFD